MSDEIKNQDEVMEASAPVANKGVVTPEKDPEKSSLASVDKAGDATKPSKKEKVTKIRKMHLRNYQLLIKKIQIVKRKS
jgi:hypothetical protein